MRDEICLNLPQLTKSDFLKENLFIHSIFCNIAERSDRFSDIDVKKLITSLKLKVLYERANSLKIIIAFFFVNLNEILSTEF